MFATLRLPRHLPWVFEVLFRLVHSSLLGIGLLAALVLVVILNPSANANPAGMWGALASRFQTESVVVEAVESETEPAPLGPKLEAAVDFIARRYRVARPAITDIVRTADAAARGAGLDPLLVLAVIGIESGYNPLSESVVGAQGLMQIIGKFHTDKFEPSADGQTLLDPQINVRVGVAIIKEYLRRTGNVDSALQLYAGAAEDEEFGYAGKVLAEKRRLELAVKQRARA